jgi:predicted hydrocarbon binding protein
LTAEPGERFAPEVTQAFGRSDQNAGGVNGIIFMEIAKFARFRLGDQAWSQVIAQAGVPSRIYYRVADYPDEEAVALLAALSAMMGEPVAAVLESLGEFIAPDLLRMAQFWIKPEWKTVDLIANTESTIHEVLRKEGSRVDPPRLQCRRTGPREVVVIYDSPRKMCALAKGIITGVARHYEQKVSITQPACMLEGASSCELIVTVLGE